MKSVFFISAILTNVKIMVSVSCPSPFTAAGSGCYYILNEPQINWYLAYADCMLNLKGYLAEITDQQEETNIVEFIKQADPTGSFYYWIGGSDMQKEGAFRWMTSGNYFTYTAWDGNQPDNQPDKLNNTENCAHLWSLNNVYTWNDYLCAGGIVVPNGIPYALKGLCETNPSIPPTPCTPTPCTPTLCTPTPCTPTLCTPTPYTPTPCTPTPCTPTPCTEPQTSSTEPQTSSTEPQTSSTEPQTSSKEPPTSSKEQQTSSTETQTYSETPYY